MMVPLLSVLPAVLVVLLAETGLCLGLVPCPAHCTGGGVVVLKPNGPPTIVKGRHAPELIDIATNLQRAQPGEERVTIRINNQWVQVPISVKQKISVAVKKYPNLVGIIAQILTQSNQTASTSEKNIAPLIIDSGKGTRIPATHKPTPIKVTTPKRRKPDVTKPPKKHVVPTTIKATPKSVHKQTPPSKQQKPISKEPTTRTTTSPHVVVVPPPETIVPPKPDTPLPDSNKPVVIPPDDKGVSTTVRGLIERLLNHPNFFSSTYRLLIKLGVKFPDLRKPVLSVQYGTTTISLPKPLVVRFAVTINGKTFRLPKASQALAEYTSRHPDQLALVITLLHQLGGVFSVDVKTRQLQSFSLFGNIYNFDRPLDMTLLVGGRTFVLPRDITSILVAVKNNAAEFFKVQMLLEAFGVRFKKSTVEGEIQAVYEGKNQVISSLPNVRIKIGVKQFNIPADLGAIFNSPEAFSVGAVLESLQRANVSVVVDEETAIIRGIVVGGVTISFPVAVDLRIKLYGRLYRIPRDLGKIVALLEAKGMPSDILSLLYKHYGIIPVRGRDNMVIALSFNGKQYTVKAQPTTALVLAGTKILLPRDNDKMIDLVTSGRVSLVEFLQAIQLAGYTFLTEMDGALRTIQKGAEIVQLPLEIRLAVELNGVTYRMPSDLPRLVEVVRGFGPTGVEQIMSELKKFGVRVIKKAEQLTIVFNGVTYKVHLKPGGGAQSELNVVLNGKKFALPNNISVLVSYASSLGKAGVQTLVNVLEANGVKVKMSAEGNIVSIVMQGKVYDVGGSAGGDDSIKVNIRGRVFWIPRDLPDLGKKLNNFQFSELITALLKVGARLEVDEKSYFIGARYKGRLIKFPNKFKIMVQVDQSGKKYRVPRDLAMVAQVLSKGNWKWKVVRKALSQAGLKVSGGLNGGAIKSFSFQDQEFHVK